MALPPSTTLHNGRPYCHKPCYGALFGPRGVNIGGVGSYLYNPPTHTPASSTSLSPSSFSPPRPRTGLPQGKKSPPHMKTFTGETSLCPGCGEPVYFAEKVMSLGRNWHRPCLRCQRCQKTLTAGSHAEVCRAGMGVYAGRRETGDGKRQAEMGFLFLSLSQHDGLPYCHVLCYGCLFVPKGGQPYPDAEPRVWHVYGLWGCEQLPLWSNTPQPSSNSPQPSTEHHKALGDGVLSLRCEHWRRGLLHL
ncbi:cysteine-rich protein 3 isoform X3 [Loxodonta africana]|uniref:cysteine-rich protein 3 isoform X3 n=1 Tax=Loxodonta africana TaxID=9785 RepID=UPI0030D332AA